MTKLIFGWLGRMRSALPIEDLIERIGDGADVAGKRGHHKQLPQLGGRQRDVPQDVREHIQQVDQNLPRALVEVQHPLFLRR